MERSRAIKSPSVHYQLAGSKKVQQALAMPGVVERFLTEPESVKRVKSSFAGLYPLDHVRLSFHKLALWYEAGIVFKVKNVFVERKFLILLRIRRAMKM